MQGGGRHPFFNFGGPFGTFGGFGGFGGFDLTSRILGGHDPFDDLFFASPYQTMFGSGVFRSAGLLNPIIPGIIGNEHLPPRRLREPVIEEVNSDDEKVLEESRKEEGRGIRGHIGHETSSSRCLRGPIIEELNSDDEERKEEGKGVSENPRKHRRSTKEPFVEDPDNGTLDKKRKYTPSLINTTPVHHLQAQPQSHSFTFQSSTVSYGGENGAYYTSSRTRRTGGDGLLFEECKEADSSTRQAIHRVTRGIHEKGHSVTRKLASDGHVDTMQTLHNLNEDELGGFSKAWKRNVKNHLPLYQDQGLGGISQQQGHSVGWALPSTESSNNVESGWTTGIKHRTKRGSNNRTCL